MNMSSGNKICAGKMERITLAEAFTLNSGWNNDVVDGTYGGAIHMYYGNSDTISSSDLSCILTFFKAFKTNTKWTLSYRAFAASSWGK